MPAPSDGALEQQGIIARCAAALDEAALRVPGVAFVQVSLDQQGRASLDRFEAAVVPIMAACSPGLRTT